MSAVCMGRDYAVALFFFHPTLVGCIPSAVSEITRVMSEKPRILVIEDQAPMRRNIALLLEMEGYHVATAANGTEGLKQVDAFKPELVLCDVMMPDLDGHGVIQALRNDPAKALIPFVFLTAKGDKNDVRMGMNYGADDYLTKPVVKEDLLAAVSARLSRAQAVAQKVQAAADSASFNPDFTSPGPLQRELALTGRESDVLLWVAQGKSNGDIATILEMSEKTVKQHLGSVFQKIGVESRTAATLRALEILSAKRV
jgi:DNA-binding NarL/FixJ family response regulator